MPESTGRIAPAAEVTEVRPPVAAPEKPIRRKRGLRIALVSLASVIVLLGAVAAVAISDLPVYFVNLYSGYREGVGTLGQDLKLTLGFACLLTLALTLRVSLGFGSPFAHIR